MKFVWGPQQAEAFEKLKELITREETLAYFKNNCKSRIGDAGPTGLGCCPFCNNSMSCGGLCHMHPET